MDSAMFSAQVAACADPARAAADLEHWLALGGAARKVLGLPGGAEAVLMLGQATRYGFETACRRPDWLFDMLTDREYAEVWGRRTITAELTRLTSLAVDDAAADLVLIDTKDEHHLRIVLGDLSGRLGFEAVVSELSDLVDALAQQALARARAALAQRHPGAWPTFVVLGLGKLGGRELNYSSDVDFIFIYESADGADSDDQHQKARKLGTEFIRLLGEPRGRTLLRVDMRLRPEGDHGELALTLRETIDYYYTVGRPWERQAMIKARPVAGDLALGNRLLAELRPWVYPLEPAWEALEESRTMRRRIEERSRIRDVKTGAGGIRDIEFLAQHFQLAHGGRDEGLRGRATLPTLRALAQRGVLPGKDTRELERHYIFLRTVEHRLQMWEDRQQHEVPADGAGMDDLAARMGFSGAERGRRLAADLAATRSRVRALASQHFLERTPDHDALLALVVQGEDAPEELAQRVLGASGLTDIRRACEHLRRIADEPFLLVSRERTRRKLLEVLPAILHLVAVAPDPDQALANFARVVGAVGGRAIFFELLAGRPRVLRVFAEMAGWSSYLADLFEHFPGLPDEVADALSRRPGARVQLQAECRSLIQGLPDPGPPLAFLVARETAIIAVKDLEGGDPAELSQRHALVAETVLDELLRRIVQERARDWGVPQQDGRPCRFAVLGLGKLGGRELAYASDMDVIFVCDPGGTCRKSDKDGEEFWRRCAQDLVRTAQESRIYEIDARLRPYGDQGELVVSTRALERYWSAAGEQAEQREVWERMAMVRVSHLAGDPRLGAEVVAALRRHAIGAAAPADLSEQVLAMRQRLEDSVNAREHLKRGTGGYVDVEFIAQAQVLGLDPQRLPEHLSTTELLVQLGRLGRIPVEAVAPLTDGLAFLRFVEARLRLAAGKATSTIPGSGTQRSELARRCGFDDPAAFEARLDQVRTANRQWFLRLTRPMTIT